MYEREKKTASVKLNMTMEDMVRNILYFPKERAKEYQCVESSLEKITEKQLTLKLLLSFYAISINHKHIYDFKSFHYIK